MRRQKKVFYGQPAAEERYNTDDNYDNTWKYEEKTPEALQEYNFNELRVNLLYN